jgi:hypothetical protein
MHLEKWGFYYKEKKSWYNVSFFFVYKFKRNVIFEKVWGNLFKYDKLIEN